MKQIFCLTFCALLLSSCEEANLNVDVSKTESRMETKRFDQALFEVDVNQIDAELPSLAKEFPVFIGDDYTNKKRVEGLVDYILNPLNQKLYLKSMSVFDDFSSIEEQLADGFKHYRYYFPDSKNTTVYSYISGLNYEQPIIVSDTFLLIGLDLFLGASFDEYANFQIPQYITKRFDKKYLPYETMRQLALYHFGNSLNGETLLDYMISLGKIEYFVEAMYPEKEDSLRFAFTPVQMQWCKEREKAFWDHLAQKNLLFSKDYHSFKKYIEDQPFISSLERESPGKAGIWLGYRIVKQYMEKHPKVGLSDLLLNKNQTEIFQASKYHP